MSNIYFIRYKNTLYSTYTDKGLVIGCVDDHKLHRLKNVLFYFKKNNNKWINVCEKFEDVNHKKALTMSPFGKQMNDRKENLNLELLALDMDDDRDVEYLYLLNNACNCDLFIMHDFDYNDYHSLLSMQGIHIKSEQYESNEGDFSSYLDVLYKK